MSCGVGHRYISNLALLWLWLAATALIRPLAWEPPYAAGEALKKKRKKKKRRRRRQKSIFKENYNANNEVPLGTIFSVYIQYPVVNHNGKNMKKNICT